MPAYTYPGLYLEEVQNAPRQELRTAIPVFLGYVRRHAVSPRSLTHWSEFELHFGSPVTQGYLAYAIRGFFENGGRRCYVVPLGSLAKPEDAVRAALRMADRLPDADVLCAPDLMVTPSGEKLTVERVVSLQALLLHPEPRNGDTGEPLRFSILDSLQGADIPEERQHCVSLLGAARQRGAGDQEFAGAGLYYPWIAVPRMAPPGEPAAVGEKVDTIYVPPCGHIAGVYARTDEDAGIRKAPANEVLHGVLDLEAQLSDDDQGSVFASDSGDIPPGAINCLRAFPGRGIRIWGARTLSADASWRHINVRRLFIAAVRWIERNMNAMAFEPNNPDLWPRIRRELNSYCFELFRHGLLKGGTVNEAFYVRCDETTNPGESRRSGIVVAEVGLAAARPYEFIVIRLIHKDGGIVLAGAGTASF